MTAITTDEETSTETRAGPLGIAGWVLYDWAAQPFFTLITTFFFSPYFVNHLMSDPVHGQAVWGYTMGAAAILVALGSPVLGAMADARGRLKTYIAWLSVAFVASQAALWFAVPQMAHIWLPILAIIVGTMVVEFITVLNNSLMPRIVPGSQVGRLSGTGWAIGYLGGLISLVLMAAFVLIDAKTGKTMLGLSPLLPFDASQHEPERFTGPFSAIWYVLFVLPFFLFTPDVPLQRTASRVSVRAAFAELGNTLRHLGAYRDLVLFFLARMFFIDGLMAIFAFGGIYGQSVFGWDTTMLGVFGIIITLAGGIGAVIGGVIDDRAGGGPLIIGSLIILMIGAVGVISIDAQHVLFVIEVTPYVAGAKFLSHPAEQAFIAFGALIGLTAGPLQSASRSLLARMAPRERISEFYGFFAFSGKATAFAAPILVGAVTMWSGSQRIALSMILVLLGLGLLLMLFVNTKRAEEAGNNGG
jgi:UMF1 family MFS transporter